MVLHSRRYPRGAQISDYYSNAAQRIRKDILEREDEYVANVDTGEFAEYLMSEYDLPLLVIRDDDTKVEEARDVQTDRSRFGEVIHREIPVMIIRMSLEPAERIEDVLSLMPSTYTTSFPEFDLEEFDVVGRIRNPNSDEVGSWIGQIKSWFASRNDDVKRMSPDLHATTIQLIGQRKRTIAEKRSKFDEIAKTLGVPLRRRRVQRPCPPFPYAAASQLSEFHQRQDARRSTAFPTRT